MTGQFGPGQGGQHHGPSAPPSPSPEHPCPYSLAPPRVQGLGRCSLPVEACLRSSPVCSGQVPDPGPAWECGARSCRQQGPHPGREAGARWALWPGAVLAKAPALSTQTQCHPCWEGWRLCGVPMRGHEQTSAALPTQTGCSKPWGGPDPLRPPATWWAGRAAPAMHHLPRPVLTFGGHPGTQEHVLLPPGVRVPPPAMVLPSQLGTHGGCQPAAAQPTPGGDQAQFGTELDPATCLASGSGLLSGAAKGLPREQPRDKPPWLIGTGGKSAPKPWGSRRQQQGSCAKSQCCGHPATADCPRPAGRPPKAIGCHGGSPG